MHASSAMHRRYCQVETLVRQYTHTPARFARLYPCCMLAHAHTHYSSFVSMDGVLHATDTDHASMYGALPAQAQSQRAAQGSTWTRAVEPGAMAVHASQPMATAVGRAKLNLAAGGAGAGSGIPAAANGAAKARSHCWRHIARTMAAAVRQEAAGAAASTNTG